jgi:hypothetical protein
LNFEEFQFVYKQAERSAADRIKMRLLLKPTYVKSWLKLANNRLVCCSPVLDTTLIRPVKPWYTPLTKSVVKDDDLAGHKGGVGPLKKHSCEDVKLATIG